MVEWWHWLFIVFAICLFVIDRFLARRKFKKVSMDGIVVVWMVRMLKRIASFLQVSGHVSFNNR